jgi:sterol desaturase/sphingolipid hydroxylase (fatty acid hydroxylase superfamily)
MVFCLGDGLPYTAKIMPSTDAELIRLLVFVAGLIFFLILELLIPYRPSTVSKFKRWVNNISLSIFSSIILRLFFVAPILQTIFYVGGNRLGVLNMISLPYWARIIGTLAFLDFMLYVWHLLNHEVPFLWRFHRVHHSDLNMDVSTANRFHIGELAMSAVIKIGLIFFLGADLLGVTLYEILIVATAQFHHSSLEVPPWFENIYWVLFVPPSMHRIHHSVVIKERNTNYGTIFSVWDRLLGTLLRYVNQERIRIGVGAYNRPEKLHFHHLLAMPATRLVR